MALLLVDKTICRPLSDNAYSRCHDPSIIVSDPVTRVPYRNDLSSHLLRRG